VSFLTSIRKVIHTTPILRQVSKSYADTFGMGKAYAEFDAKIGYTEDGDATPAASSSAGFGADDLAGYLTEQTGAIRNSPGVSMMVDQYRDAQRLSSQYRVGRLRPAVTRVPLEEDLEEDMGDEEDYGDEEEQ